MEFRNGNLFGATFGVAYACFLFTTPMILRWFAPRDLSVRSVGGFGDSFGAYLLMWAVFTAFMTYGAYYVNLPAFLAFLLLVVVYAARRDREHRRARRAPRCCASPAGSASSTASAHGGSASGWCSTTWGRARSSRMPYPYGSSSERRRCHARGRVLGRPVQVDGRAGGARPQPLAPGHPGGRVGAARERVPRRVPGVDGRADRQQRLRQRRARRRPRRAHMLCGPIAVEGAEPGDLLVVDILDLGPVPRRRSTATPPARAGATPGSSPRSTAAGS